MWDLPGPEIEPVSPALAGGFLTTAPPGKSPREILNVESGNIGAHRSDLFIIISFVSEIHWPLDYGARHTFTA